MTREIIQLADGYKMPVLGLGTFQLSGENCEQIVYNAIKIGVRLIDTAAAYENELYVGNAIRKAISDGIVSRTDLFVSTKIWIQDFGDKKTDAAFERSLKRLGLEYVDLCLLHYPYGDTYGAWRTLVEKKKEGKTKSIGVSNFLSNHLVDFCLHNEVKPVINQVETNPYIQQVSEQELMKDLGVQMEAWSPLATGKNRIWENRILRSIAKKHNVSVSQVVIRWLLQRGIVIVAKSSSIDHIRENIDVFKFELDDRDMKKISRINRETSVYFGVKQFNDYHVAYETGSAIFKT